MTDLPIDESLGLEPLCHIVTPVGMLGYGLDEALTSAALTRVTSTGVPTAIILDSGSTDGGPSKLALGSLTCPPSAYTKDLTKLLRLVHSFKVPLIFTSAGGDGTAAHVDLMLGLIQQIAAEDSNNYNFKAISLYSNIDKEVVLERLKTGRVAPCGACVPALTENDVEAASVIVAQMGPEAIVDAMETHPDFDIIIGGRAYDPAPYVAFATFQLKRKLGDITYKKIQERNGGFTHMGKIMECGGVCAEPKSAGAIATVYTNGVFDVTPLDSSARCTPVSVAAHALYENTRPDILQGPGGSLHLENSKYEQLADEKTVRVSGSTFRTSEANAHPYRLKLEGARVVGYRSVFMGSIRDPVLVSQIDNLLLRVKGYVNQQHPGHSGQWDLGFHVYGREPNQAVPPAGLFIVAEAVAPTQLLAASVASKARVAIIHGPYPGQKATAGNFGFGIGGFTEIEAGPCCNFCVYHLMDLNAGEERLAEAVEQTEPEQRRLLRQSVTIIGKAETVDSQDTGSKTTTAMEEETRTGTAGSGGATKSQNGNVVEDAVSRPIILSDLARVLRSKNAGPFEITIDIIFKSEHIYKLVKGANLLSREVVATALNVSQEDIVWSGYFDPANAFKVTFPRFRDGKKTAAGGFMEDDMHGTQHHTGVWNIVIPHALRDELADL